MVFILTKRVLAVVLVVCMFLPLSRCERDTTSSPSAQETLARATDKTTSEDFIPIKLVEFSDVSTWIFMLPFIWPLPLTSVQRRIRIKWMQWALKLLELALIAYSAYLIYFWATLGKTLLGGYTALACIIAYALTFLAENFVLLKNHMEK